MYHSVVFKVLHQFTFAVHEIGGLIFSTPKRDTIQRRLVSNIYNFPRYLHFEWNCRPEIISHENSLFFVIHHNYLFFNVSVSVLLLARKNRKTNQSLLDIFCRHLLTIVQREPLLGANKQKICFSFILSFTHKK